MSCDNYPSKKDVEDFALNAKVINEFTTATGELTPSAASDGKQKITLSEIWRQANEKSITEAFLYDHTWNPWAEGETSEAGKVYAYEWSSGRVTLLSAKSIVAMGAEPDFSYFDLVTDRVNAADFGAVGDGVADDTAAIQAAIDYAAKMRKVAYIDGGTYSFTNIILTSGIAGFVGEYGTSSTRLIRIPTASGTAIRWNGSTRIRDAMFANLYIQGNTSAGETHGFDVSGISYSMLMNIRCRLFSGDGWIADGVIEPVVSQVSNNTFINCTGNNNLGSGISLIDSSGARVANSALTFLGCEFAGNAKKGINGEQMYSCHFYNVTAQGNAERDIYCNGVNNIFSGYMEGIPASFELTSLSERNTCNMRSSYPLWNTFIDEGSGNAIGIGSISKGEQLNSDPLFNNFVSARPGNVYPASSVIIGTDDSGEIMTVTDSAGAANSITIMLNKSADNLRGRWVTLSVEMDSLDAVSDLNTRVYAQIDSTTNQLNGTFAVKTLKRSNMKRYFFDVKFPDIAGSACSILFYFSYLPDVGGSVVKVRSAHVTDGQSAYYGNYSGENAALSASTASLADASLAINTYKKHAGKIVYATNAGQIYFALGSAASASWRSVAGGDITPS